MRTTTEVPTRQHENVSEPVMLIRCLHELPHMLLIFSTKDSITSGQPQLPSTPHLLARRIASLVSLHQSRRRWLAYHQITCYSLEISHNKHSIHHENHYEMGEKTSLTCSTFALGRICHSRSKPNIAPTNQRFLRYLDTLQIIFMQVTALVPL